MNVGRRFVTTTLALAVALAACPVFAARVPPLEATVFIRVIGHVRVLRGEDERVWREQLLDVREVEVGTGSGFVVSPHGWVVTSNHAVRGERSSILLNGEILEVAIDINRIEVVLPPESIGSLPRRFTASIHAADPELDLAILYVSGNDLPYVGLGDSDAVASGDSAVAVGYPFGEALELGRHTDSETVPSPSTATGTVSALRLDASGDRRYLQLSAVLNPGNSGGPIVDSEGYAIGVAQLRLKNAPTIGFATPINLVKQFLQTQGLEANLPVRLLALGGFIDDQRKGVRVRAPVGFEDLSPLRLRLDTAAEPNTLALRVDRLASSYSVEQLETQLLSAGAFERFHATGSNRRSASRVESGHRVLRGRASGTDETGEASKVVYALVDLGSEKIVARYTGPADVIAANQSILQASLAELSVRPLITAELTRPVQPKWGSANRHGANNAGIPTVEGWVGEPGLPVLCGVGLSPPVAGVAMSPAEDFTVAFRAAWRDGETMDPLAAVRDCGVQPGGFGETSYASRATALGITYQVDGAFVRIPGRGVWQLEVTAPLDKSRFVRDLFGAWVRQLTLQ